MKIEEALVRNLAIGETTFTMGPKNTQHTQKLSATLLHLLSPFSSYLSNNDK